MSADQALGIDALIAETAAIARAFVDAGHRLYLVGGIVRDLRLGRARADGLDIDLTTDATPDQVKTVIGPLVDAMWFQGERFGTIGALVGARVIEVTTHRSEVYQPGSRKPAVTYSTAIEEDLSRRDFTINAMALSLPDAVLVDPFGGEADLARKRLRTPLDPVVSFEDDPLRMLRAARFVAGYDLTPDAALVEAMARLGPRIGIVSVERIRDELDKLLCVDDPTAGFELLAATGLLAHRVDWLGDLVTASTVPVIPGLPARADLRLAALLLGMANGDPATSGGPTRTRDLIVTRMLELRYPRARATRTGAVVAAAAAVVDGRVVDAPSCRRWWHATGDRRDEALALVATIDPASVRMLDELTARLADDLDDLEPPIGATDVMDILGVEPGPVVGRALAHLRSLRFDRGPMTPGEAADALRVWRDDQST